MKIYLKFPLFFILACVFHGNFVYAEDINWYREEARQLFRRRLCGVCHIPPGNAKALKIFDLDKPTWISTVSNRQIEEFRWRIEVKGQEVREMKGDLAKHEFSKQEISFIKKFVDEELKFRNSGQPPY